MKKKSPPLKAVKTNTRGYKATADRTTSSSDLVLSIVDKIDAMVAKGELLPGQQLVEVSLMKTLNVGRVPIREALRILAGDGVVELSRNRSARIRMLDPVRLAQMFDVLAPLFEAAMTYFLQSKPGPRAIKALCVARDRIAVAMRSGSASKILESTVEYHQVTVRYSGNDYLNEIIHRLHIPHYRRELAAIIGLPAMLECGAKYGLLTDCLIAGDLAGAGAIMTPDLTIFRQRLRHQADITLAPHRQPGRGANTASRPYAPAPAP